MEAESVLGKSVQEAKKAMCRREESTSKEKRKKKKKNETRKRKTKYP